METKLADPRNLQLRTLQQMLDDPDGLKPPQAVIPRLAWAGRLVLLSGREKLSGKSTLLTAACAVASRAPLFPEWEEDEEHFLGEPVAPATVLWVSSDQEHAADIAARAVRFGAYPEGFSVLWPGAEPLKDLEAAWHKLGEPNLVVIDTLAAFAHGAVEKAASSDGWPDIMQPLLRCARLGSAVVVLHHATKGPDSTYRDSTAIAAAVDQTIALKPVPDHVTWRKVESIGRLGRDEFTVALEDDAYRIVGGAEIAASTERGRERMALHAALGNKEWSAKDLAMTLDWQKRTTERRLQADPQVTRRQDGETYLYSLTTSRTELGPTTHDSAIT